jgi:hypothetical protein
MSFLKDKYSYSENLHNNKVNPITSAYTCVLRGTDQNTVESTCGTDLHAKVLASCKYQILFWKTNNDIDHTTNHLSAQNKSSPHIILGNCCELC